jgi:hypothetical protein
MATWQVVFLAFVVLLPLALLADLYPDRERLDSRGRPLERDWIRQFHPQAPDEGDHH